MGSKVAWKMAKMALHCHLDLGTMSSDDVRCMVAALTSLVQSCGRANALKLDHLDPPPQAFAFGCTSMSVQPEFKEVLPDAGAVDPSAPASLACFRATPEPHR